MIPGRTFNCPFPTTGNIGLCVGTLIARYVKPKPFPGWNSQEQAWAHTQGQLAWYKEMESKGVSSNKFKIEVKKTFKSVEIKPISTPLGYVLSLEEQTQLYLWII